MWVACCVQSCGSALSTGSSIGKGFIAPFAESGGIGQKSQEKSGTGPITLNAHAPQGTHRKENDPYERRAAYFGFGKIPKLSGEVNDKKTAHGSR
jgi:hypothetical protein